MRCSAQPDGFQVASHDLSKLLWGARVLHARRRGHAPPEPNGAPWEHLAGVTTALDWGAAMSTSNGQRADSEDGIVVDLNAVRAARARTRFREASYKISRGPCPCTSDDLLDAASRGRLEVLAAALKIYGPCAEPARHGRADGSSQQCRRAPRPCPSWPLPLRVCGWEICRRSAIGSEGDIRRAHSPRRRRAPP